MDHMSLYAAPSNDKRFGLQWYVTCMSQIIPIAWQGVSISAHNTNQCPTGLTDAVPAQQSQQNASPVFPFSRQADASPPMAHWHAVHAVQVRPLLSFEKAKSNAECVEVPSTTVVQLPPRRGTSSDPFRFDFDRVYKMNNPGAGHSSMDIMFWQELVDSTNE